MLPETNKPTSRRNLHLAKINKIRERVRGIIPDYVGQSMQCLMPFSALVRSTTPLAKIGMNSRDYSEPRERRRVSEERERKERKI